MTSRLIDGKAQAEIIHEEVRNRVAALKKAGVDHKIYRYEGAGHAFMNDTGARYHKESAELAWRRTVDILKEKLKT